MEVSGSKNAEIHVPGKHSVPFVRQLWLVLGVKLMEINSNMVSRWTVILEFPYHDRIPSVFQPENGRSQGPKGDEGPLKNQPHIHRRCWVFIGYIPLKRGLRKGVLNS